jgi:hypothetical protein
MQKIIKLNLMTIKLKNKLKLWMLDMAMLKRKGKMGLLH